MLGPGTESVLGPLFRNFLRLGGGGVVCVDLPCQKRSNAAFLSTIRVTFGLNPGPSTVRARYNCTPCTPLNPALDEPYFHTKEEKYTALLKTKPKMRETFFFFFSKKALSPTHSSSVFSHVLFIKL
jgi:hypothetical protein